MRTMPIRQQTRINSLPKPFPTLSLLPCLPWCVRQSRGWHASRPPCLARLWEMRTQEMSLAQIAAELQAESVPTLSGEGIWQKGTVAKLLRKK